ncbi:MAG TPA: hypothetical protein VFD33_08250 [Bacillota bacterium]|nr:hypothetical protein [Bacillota bacterium]
MNWLKRFMVGRYGADQLYVGLVLASVAFLILSTITGWQLFIFLSLLLFAYGYFRVFSRNIWKRSQENLRFLKLWNPLKNKFKRDYNRLKHLRTHKYYKCVGCKQSLRVPRKRGKIRIVCPRCKSEMIKKT